MTSWLLDTSVLSELRRKKPDRKVVAVITAAPIDRLYVTSVTPAEMRLGNELLPEAPLRAIAGLTDASRATDIR